MRAGKGGERAGEWGARGGRRSGVLYAKGKQGGECTEWRAESHVQKPPFATSQERSNLKWLMREAGTWSSSP